MTSFKKLDFSVVGPQKAGTTWVHEYIKKDPGVCLPSAVKETFFFDRHFTKGLDWYFSHFSCNGEGLLYGEVAPTYFDDPGVPERMRSHNKGMKIVVTLRNPYERTWSLYVHFLKYGMVTGEFSQAVEEAPRILSSSKYATHLKRWFEAFGRDNVQVVFGDELKTDPAGYLLKICSFIGLEYRDDPEFLKKKVNAGEMTRSPHLARAANRSARALRDLKMYGVVNLAKKMGLKKVFFSGGKVPEGPLEEHIELMRQVLDPEISELEGLISTDLALWKAGERVRVPV